MSAPRAASLRAPALLVLALLPACRGCSTPPTAEPPPRASADAVLAALGDALHGDAPVERLLARLPEATRRASRAPLTSYVFCTAPRDTAACARLDGEARSLCREAAAQVNARAADEHPWFAIAEGLRFCGEHAPAEQCARYAAAVEGADPARCAGLGEGLDDCAAVAAGDGALCPKLGSEASSCHRAVREVAALRRGVDALASTPSGRWRAAAIGRLRGAAACDAELREQLDAPRSDDDE